MHARLSTALLLGAALIVGPAVTAEAGSLRCGDVVTQDVVLQRDLTCAGNALLVDVPVGRTLQIDLNGHRLKGNGTGSGIGGRAVNPANRDGNLVVTNGTITGFAAAFLEAGAGDRVVATLTLRNLRVVANGVWLFSRTRPRTLIENTRWRTGRPASTAAATWPGPTGWVRTASGWSVRPTDRLVPPEARRVFCRRR